MKTIQLVLQYKQKLIPADQKNTAICENERTLHPFMWSKNQVKTMGEIVNSLETCSSLTGRTVRLPNLYKWTADQYRTALIGHNNLKQYNFRLISTLLLLP